MSKQQLGPSFYFVGFYECLDFINTEIVVNGQPVDLLNNFESLVLWLLQSGNLDPVQAAGAQSRWGGARDGARILDQAKKLRSSLHQAVKRVVAGKGVLPSVVGAINLLLTHQTGYYEVQRAKGGGYEKRSHAIVNEAAQLLVPIAESFADLICYGDLSLIRKCENPACVLYFYDTTKNHARRWCSMSVCGNRAKAAAHYQRKRRAAALQSKKSA